VLVAAAAVVFVELLPFLVAVLAVAAVLAALSTWRTWRQRRALLAHGWPVPRVGVPTYLGYLAGWFVGLLVFIPLLLFGAAVAFVVLIAVGAALMAGLILSLFRV